MRPRWGDATITDGQGGEPDKVVEAILSLVWEAEGLSKPLSQFDAISALFLADRESVDRRGTAITGDTYVAMPHGPVGSRAYDFLKSDGGSIPWSRSLQQGRRAVLFHSPSRPVHHAALARADVAELARALATVKALGYGDTLRLTSGDEDYRLARANARTRAPALTIRPRAGRLATAVMAALAKSAGGSPGAPR